MKEGEEEIGEKKIVGAGLGGSAALAHQQASSLVPASQDPTPPSGRPGHCTHMHSPTHRNRKSKLACWLSGGDTPLTPRLAFHPQDPRGGREESSLDRCLVFPTPMLGPSHQHDKVTSVKRREKEKRKNESRNGPGGGGSRL